MNMNVLLIGAETQLGLVVEGIALGSRHSWIKADAVEMSDDRAFESFLDLNDINVVVNCSYEGRSVSETAAICRRNCVRLIQVTEDTSLELNDVSGVILLRTSWLYGIEGHDFVKEIIEQTADQPLLSVPSDQIGAPTFADDLAELIVRIIEEGNSDREGIYDYTDEGVCSLYDFAHEICAMTGHLCEVLPCASDEDSGQSPYMNIADRTPVKEVFGISIPYWRDSLMVCINALNNKE